MFRNKLREAGLTPPIPNARTSMTLFHQIRDKLWPILTYVDFLDNGIYDYLRFRKPISKCVVVDPDGFLIAPLLDVSKFVLWCYYKVSRTRDRFFFRNEKKNTYSVGNLVLPRQSFNFIREMGEI